MKTYLSKLDSCSNQFIWRLCLFQVLILLLMFIFIGEQVLIEPLFIFPVVLASWYGSKKSGICITILSEFLLLSIKYSKTGFELIEIITYGLPFLIAFSALAILITNFRNVHRVESNAADTDHLTGIKNLRGFYIELAKELQRSSRYKHTFSLAYLDIDNFKLINDSHGHSEGDKLLVEVAKCLTESLRSTDIVARVGGDEFVCLLTETDDQDAKNVFSITRDLLRLRMSDEQWPVSFSVGFVTFKSAPASIKEVLEIADSLMYTVKNADKNDICCKIWDGEFLSDDTAVISNSG